MNKMEIAKNLRRASDMIVDMCMARKDFESNFTLKSIAINQLKDLTLIKWGIKNSPELAAAFKGLKY